MLSAPLLITGDTGKSAKIFAYARHRASPSFSEASHLALNCASIPEDAGRKANYLAMRRKVKGFLNRRMAVRCCWDEIGEMSPRMQAKLLRFLNDGTFRRVGEDHEIHVDVRVIFHAEKNLVELVQKDCSGEDLYYRLNVLTLNLPPLRDCPQDCYVAGPNCSRVFADAGHPRSKLFADLSGLIVLTVTAGRVTFASLKMRYTGR